MNEVTLGGHFIHFIRVESNGEERRDRTGTAALPRPQRIKAEILDSMGNLHRHTVGTDGARPKNGTHLRRGYILLVPTGPAVDPATAENQVSGDGHEANMGTADQAWKQTETWGRNRQHVLPSCGMQGVTTRSG